MLLTWAGVCQCAWASIGGGVFLLASGGMDANQRRSELSFAYLAALCAMAGFTCQRGPTPDLDSVDATVRNVGPSGGSGFDVQLKATSSPNWKPDGLHFRLKRKNYDDLRKDRSMKIVLVVLELPRDPKLWLESKADELVMRRCAWWDWLYGVPEIKSATRTWVIPDSQRFDLEAIKDIIERIREKGPLKG